MGRKLNIDNTHVVGNSLGEATALRMALTAPDRIDRMILMGPAGIMPAHTVWPTEGISRMFQYYQGDGPSMEKLRSVVELLVFDPTSVTEELLARRFKISMRPEVVADPHGNRFGHPDDQLWLAPLDALESTKPY